MELPCLESSGGHLSRLCQSSRPSPSVKHLSHTRIGQTSERQRNHSAEQGRCSCWSVRREAQPSLNRKRCRRRLRVQAQASAAGADWCTQQQTDSSPDNSRNWRPLLTAVCAALILFTWFQWSSWATVPTPGFLSASAATLSNRASSSPGLAHTFNSGWAGLAAGFLHTLAGADHLAALTPLTIGRSAVMATLLGALWGLGHSTGQLILGLAMIALKDRFDQLVPMLSRWGGTTVGLTLLWIGLAGLYESMHEDPQTVTSPETVQTLELQTQVETAGPGPSMTVSQRQGPGWFTFATGVVYGLQPDALFVIVPALALPTKSAAAAYILLFVIGTVTAMGGYTAVIGATSRAVKQRSAGITTHLSTIASGVAVAVGAGILASCWGVHIPIISSLIT